MLEFKQKIVYYKARERKKEMFNFELTLSHIQSRKRQFGFKLEQLAQFTVIVRFGSIKFQVKLSFNGSHFIGGKRIILDLSQEELRSMFSEYALGMFCETNSNASSNQKYFGIISLEKLSVDDIVSGQEVYFYNDCEDIVFSAALSIVFGEVKNPRLPQNKDKIENHKTFDEFFKKPAVPTHNVQAKTLSSFLYGKKLQQQSNKLNATSASGRNPKSKPAPSKGIKTKMSSTTNQQWLKKSQEKAPPEYVATLTQQQLMQRTYQNPYGYDPEQQDDFNPPMMEFTNTLNDQTKGISTLKNQLAQMNATSEGIKFMTAYDSKNAFIKTKDKQSANTIIKIQDKLLRNTQNSKLNETKSFKENVQIKINREQIRNKAKKQMENYQGNTKIKIPVLKDGKYELVELTHLSQEEIVNFARKQKQMEFEEQQKKAIQKQLEKRQKQNAALKKQVEEKEKMLAKQKQEAQRQKAELLKAKQLALQNQRLAITMSKAPQKSQHSSDDDYDEDEDKYESQDQYDVSANKSKQNQDEENNYESDFESMSMASGHKKSRISVNSQKKDEQSYGDSYDPDFESYSQSLLGSQPRLSMSDMSESLRLTSPKKR